MRKHFIQQIFFMVVIISLACNGFILADSAERPATQAEKDFYQKVLTVLMKAIPSKPVNWDLDGTLTSTKLERVTTGLEKYPFKVEYFINWRDNKTINDALAQQAAATAALAQDPAKMTDQALADLQKKYDPHDVTLQISLQVNYTTVYIGDPPKTMPAIADGMVYRTASKSSKEGIWVEGTTFIFLGKGWYFSNQAGNYMYYKPDPAIPSLKVQSIAVKIKADQNRAQKIIDSIDWVSLKDLFNK